MNQKILFVCLGNICRSPAAEGVFSAMVEQKDFVIDSAGTSGFHSGDKADPRMIQHAKQRGIELTSRSRKFVQEDLDLFDHILVMDDKNLQDVLKMANSEQSKKVKKITDYCTRLKYNHVPDPYYGGAQGFDLVLDILDDACKGFLKSLQQ